MLIVTRKKGQKCIIGNGIVLTALYIGKNRVKLSIDAPQYVKVKRPDNSRGKK